MRISYSLRGKERVFDKELTQVIIGRSKDGLLPDLDFTPDEKVSRPHARVWVEDGQYWIEDLNSRRGTRVNGEEIKGEGKRRLHPNDSIQIGETVLQVATPTARVVSPPSESTDLEMLADTHPAVKNPAKSSARIFLSYARPDEEKVKELYRELSKAGFKPWMDTKDILPGERWRYSINRAIRDCDFFLLCLSRHSVNKRGFLQREINDALDILREKLDSDIYLIPARLEVCETPEKLSDLQAVDLFQQEGLTQLVKAIQAGMERLAEPLGEIAESLDVSSPAFDSVKTASAFAPPPLAAFYELQLHFAAETWQVVLQKTVEWLVEISAGAMRGAVLIKDRMTGQLLLKACVPPGRPAVSMTLAQRAMDRRQAFTWSRNEGLDSANENQTESLPGSLLEHNIESAMYSPLLWKDEVFGIVSVDNPETAFAFSTDELRRLMTVAHHLAMVVASHQLEEDLKANAKLMERLLPSFSPRIRERLLEKARHGRLHPGGEKSEVTVLCSDIRGFTDLSAGMDAEDIVDMLNDYFLVLIENIFQFDGTIVKFAGDSILAVFGSPEPDARQREKAVRAALAIHAAIRELNAGRAAHGEVMCDIATGVHYGEALHGFIGAAERMEFTVIGETVNRACSYCDEANNGEVLISPEMYQVVFGIIEAEHTTIATRQKGDLTAYRIKHIK